MGAVLFACPKCGEEVGEPDGYCPPAPIPAMTTVPVAKTIGATASARVNAMSATCTQRPARTKMRTIGDGTPRQ